MYRSLFPFLENFKKQSTVYKNETYRALEIIRADSMPYTTNLQLKFIMCALSNFHHTD